MYDEESGFYYLRSRYYDPYIGRFLNADVYVSTGQSIDGYNMFAYCNSNPINGSDPTGHMHERTAGGGGPAIVIYGSPSDAGIETGLEKLWKGLLIFLGLAAAKEISRNVGIQTADDLIAEKISVRTFQRSQAVAKEKAKEKDITSAPEQYNYWKAEIIGGVVTPLEPLTYQQARDWAALENNLLCINQAAALAIVSFYPHYICDPPHNENDCRYLPHYHLNNGRDPETGYHRSHIWYLG